MARTGGEDVDAALGVAGVLDDLAGVPVVEDLVVVPEDHLRDLGLEAAHVRVEAVVEVVPAELVEGLGHLRLGRGHEVAPHAAVVEHDLGREGIVPVDRVPQVHEEVRAGDAHRLVGGEPTPRLVDAPALPAGVGGEGEAHVGLPGRGRAERARHGQAPGARVAQVLEEHAVDDALAGREALEVEPGGEAVRLDRRLSRNPARVREGLAGGPLDEQASGPVAPRPDDRATARHVPHGGPVGRGRSGRLGRDEGGRAGGRAGGERRAQEAAAGPQRPAQEPPTRRQPPTRHRHPLHTSHCPPTGGRRYNLHATRSGTDASIDPGRRPDGHRRSGRGPALPAHVGVGRPPAHPGLVHRRAIRHLHPLGHLLGARLRPGDPGQARLRRVVLERADERQGAEPQPDPGRHLGVPPEAVRCRLRLQELRTAVPRRAVRPGSLGRRLPALGREVRRADLEAPRGLRAVAQPRGVGHLGPALERRRDRPEARRARRPHEGGAGARA